MGKPKVSGFGWVVWHPGDKDKVMIDLRCGVVERLRLPVREELLGARGLLHSYA